MIIDIGSDLLELFENLTGSVFNQYSTELQ